MVHMVGDHNRAGESKRVVVHDARPSYSRRSYDVGINYNGRTRHGSSYGPGFRRHRANNVLVTILPYAVFLLVLGICFIWIRCGPVPASTHVREKLDSGVGFDEDCVVDEIDWVYNPSGVADLLRRGFYDSTGVRPYVVFHAYDGALRTDEDKDRWARDYYAKNIRDGDAFLYVYFAEPDTDTYVGYMTCVCGDDAASVMDAEAVRIFWAYVDQEWYG
ncbi:MAG: hypothetical protein HDQ88_02890, partial [Clostridia bacterium]|nr:hypothetical protein [Clostridia bacterium]